MAAQRDEGSVAGQLAKSYWELELVLLFFQFNFPFPMPNFGTIALFSFNK